MKRLCLIKLGILVLLGAAPVGILAADCELRPIETTAHGEHVHRVSGLNGKALGELRQQRNGTWEAIVVGLGALNREFVSVQEAHAALCELLRRNRSATNR